MLDSPPADPKQARVLVVGGGISGVSAALELAEYGVSVVLVERAASLGGWVSRLHKYFPKLCRPACGQEINLRRLEACANLRVVTLAEVTGITGGPGAYTATLRRHPRYVNENCTACGACAEAVEATIPNPHNLGLDQIKAAYLPHAYAYPRRYVLDPSIVGTEQGAAAKAACRYDAIDLEMQPVEETIECGAVILATGWQPYDAAKIQPYGYDRYANVITSVEFERLADPLGPTGGKLLRPSDNQPARDIAFIQCAGSRDRNHLAHCSRVCCMASLKQATYINDAYGDDAEAKASIYYIDLRTLDRHEDFERRVRRDGRVHLIKSKPAEITEDGEGNPVLHGVDTHGAVRYANRHDLAVLAVGMQPSLDAAGLGGDWQLDGAGFIQAGAPDGLQGAGCARGPFEVSRAVQSATAAALRAVHVLAQAQG